MVKFFVMLLAFALVVSAGIKKETATIILPDTVLVIKQDTTKFFRLDTTRITKTYNDSLIFLKADTSKSPGKLVQVPKTVPSKTQAPATKPVKKP